MTDTCSLQLGRILPRAAGRPTKIAEVSLYWTAVRPHEVAISTFQGARTAMWRLCRDLLAEGLERPVGVGDYSIFPDVTLADGEGIELVLCNRTRRDNVALPLLVAPIRALLERSYASVPAGTEQLSWDTTDIAGGLA